ncbi:hypothetical protein 8014-B2_001 [Lactobacillus phage ATCC 8014-B2]|uniref:Uncharacterized protein n=1 Tax=Lactobacillus phage ATCC 8014-B2 TaxID=1225795 RepID=K4I0B3_9CAUD|nr:hypothetical protein HOQ89_gp001 [Lactobacillus phage ATCC 8014-B2]AFU63068.1 hypothetical protein 8014-B2_001 [Lactobacillus phage ATCC 8014-B2]
MKDKIGNFLAWIVALFIAGGLYGFVMWLYGLYIKWIIS